ncbi:MAG: hypothetical protein IH588_11375 [Anaerolineales bacterium]|nr:hypothetical protein [Anaerolineales bacterium]
MNQKIEPIFRVGRGVSLSTTSQSVNHKISFADRIAEEIALMAFFNISINGKDPALNEI